MEKKHSPWISMITFVAGSVTTTIIADVNGWFLARKFPLVFNLVGFHFSLGLSLFFTLLILVVMGVAFYGGHMYAFVTFARLMVPRMKMPLLFRVISFVSYPVFWMFSGMLLRWQKEERRMKKELEKEEHADANDSRAKSK
jgi:hypothetical protein